MKVLWLFLSLSVLSLSALGDDLIPNFQEVVSGQIYRGGQPSDGGFKELARLKIKTVLDLRNEPELIDQESLAVTSLGLSFVSAPLNSSSQNKAEDIDFVKSILKRKDLRPIFIHGL